MTTASAPGAGYNETHQYSVDRGTVVYGSTSHFQSRGPCGGASLQMTDLACTGGLAP